MNISYNERLSIEKDLGRRLDLRFKRDKKIVYSWLDKQEEKAYQLFKEASSGVFDGFKFANVFHQHYNKRDSIAELRSDDISEVNWGNKTYHIGIDGVTVYVMTERPTKIITFNRSAYLC